MGTRLPLAPLLATAKITNHSFRKAAGLNHRDAKRLVEEGLTFAQAVRYCDRLGVHPYEVWGSDWLMAHPCFTDRERAAVS